MTLQKSETIENVHNPPPSGQEVQLNATKDTITEDFIPVVNRTLTVKEKVSSAQSNKNMAATTTPDIKVISNAKVNTQSINHKWGEFIMGSSSEDKPIQCSPWNHHLIAHTSTP